MPDREAMATITIGVPVFNGMPFLPDSPRCLRYQTFSDFEEIGYRGMLVGRIFY
jgi:hypothetical protein